MNDIQKMDLIKSVGDFFVGLMDLLKQCIDFLKGLAGIEDSGADETEAEDAAD